ncbi:hypothetical protein P168DRAFT_293738 [Aspergillus campestris IBT 28561]|uniref:Mid2 domain-containing protein n=1 Tax=Aspergillus campestris (strain IBT 28561) TaxID=1392248 RepID=A0A2I1CRC2_ASPC2|nr:uncharacterized protein P168DRAFT_293738 [Aspergillus campestris IBT 28561]PKY00159.1 hypothetical protein P168DRAFT_293738 [Aspergillus campestris IBT 28561]
MSPACFAMHDGAITVIDIDLPCGVTNSSHPHVTCCVAGDYCMSNSICKHAPANRPEVFYNADCTQEAMEDPACGVRCGGKHRSDLTYNTAKGVWSCCGVNDDGTANCDNATDEIFPAPPPTWLATIQYLPPEGTPTYATSKPTPTPNSNTSAVSAGTAAGIGIGAGLGVVLLAGAIAFFFLRGRKKPIPAHQSTYYHPVPDQTPLTAPPSLSHRSWQSYLVEPQSSAVYELGKSREPSEIDTSYQPHGR